METNASFYWAVRERFPTLAQKAGRKYLDVSFVENLFWQVPPAKAAAYWKKLPLQLQALYVDFHSKPPI